MEKRVIEMILLGTFIVFLIFNMYMDWRSYSKYKEVIKLLENEAPESNYCQAWCLIYE